MALLFTSAQASEWRYTWAGNFTPQVQICPLLYGKTWAYALTVDDGPASTRFAAELAAQHTFTDAPPGVAGGQAHPIVGSAAIFPFIIAANSSYLGPDDIRALAARGWGIANHSYAHKGRHWGTPPEELSAEFMQEDLFWSQSILAHDYGEGRAPAHFVYPNGYRAYRDHFASFGIRSGSLFRGSGGRNLSNEDADFTLLDRSYLDEKQWTGPGESDPLYDLPFEEGPEPGRFQIDFTHGINTDPDSANQQRWKKRLEAISSRYGRDGDDSFWSAPLATVVDYRLAAERASVDIQPGELIVRLPETAPGSRLTLRLDGVPEDADLPVPEGGLLYQEGNTAWVTTPRLGEAGAPAPEPRIRRAATVPVGTHTFQEPVQLAGVQVKFIGRLEEATPVEVILTHADGRRETLGPKLLKAGWGNGTLLFPILPHAPAPTVRRIEVPVHPVLERMDLWILAD